MRATAQGGLRSYTLSSTHTQRDEAPSERTINELEGDPILRSGVLLTDALFAMAVEEARQNAVEQISDDAFTGVIDCSCYQTGALWNWVWTRDIAYAVEARAGLDRPSASSQLAAFQAHGRRRAAVFRSFKMQAPAGAGGLDRPGHLGSRRHGRAAADRSP